MDLKVENYREIFREIENSVKNGEDSKSLVTNFISQFETEVNEFDSNFINEIKTDERHTVVQKTCVGDDKAIYGAIEAQLRYNKDLMFYRDLVKVSVDVKFSSIVKAALNKTISETDAKLQTYGKLSRNKSIELSITDKAYSTALYDNTKAKMKLDALTNLIYVVSKGYKVTFEYDRSFGIIITATNSKGTWNISSKDIFKIAKQTYPGTDFYSYSHIGRKSQLNLQF